MMDDDADDTFEMRPCLQCRQAFEPSDRKQFFCRPACSTKYQEEHQDKAFMIYQLMLQARSNADADIRTFCIDYACHLLDETITADRKTHQVTRILDADELCDIALEMAEEQESRWTTPTRELFNGPRRSTST